MYKLVAVLQHKCTPVLVETEKNAHSQSNTVSFTVLFSVWSNGSELCLFKNLSQSVSQEKIAKFAVSLFVFYRRSRVFNISCYKVHHNVYHILLIIQAPGITSVGTYDSYLEYMVVRIIII